MQTIGQLVRALRQLQRLTQSTLATRAGITPQAISDIENEKTQSTAYLPELARALDTTAEYLRYGEAVAEQKTLYLADLDRIIDLISTGRLDARAVKAIRQLAESLSL